MSYIDIENLQKCKLLEFHWLISQKDNRQKNEHLLPKIKGFITTYNMRPPITTILSLQKLPHPKELAVVDENRVEANKSIIVDNNFVKVTSDIYRNILDDSYVFNCNDQSTHYLILSGGTPNALLQGEINKLLHQLTLSSDFPKFIWERFKISKQPTHFLRTKSSCKFFGQNWSVTITLCPDNVLRITEWINVHIPVTWDTGESFVITQNLPPLLLQPKRSKNRFSCEIEVLERYS